jgi:phenylpyruvate tautomerase PptA (4-oxalocrotonate tautomerase family)
MAELLSKPERYVMVIVEQAALRFGASTADAAFVDVRSIGGLDADTNAALAARLCELVERYGGVAPQRTFLNFANVEPSSWGYDGATF